MVAVCFAPTATPEVEHIVHVSKRVADRLLKTTASYRGVCADYGESVRAVTDV